MRSLAERDFRARYKQAFLGISWALIQPMVMVLAFTLTIQRIANVRTGNAPYALFAYLGLIAWNFFSGAVTWASTCLLNNQPLLNKVSCPREAFPAAAVLLACVDATVSLVGLAVVFVVFGFVPRGTIYYVPLYIIMEIAFTFGVSMLVSVIVVYVRDLRQVLPITIQAGLFATPVAYSITNRLPPDLRFVYCALDPVAPAIDGIRGAVLYGQGPQWSYLAAGAMGPGHGICRLQDLQAARDGHCRPPLKAAYACFASGSGSVRTAARGPSRTSSASWSAG